MSSTITTIVRLSTATATVWIHQFGIVVWFMIGQGYDRSTASLVIWAGLGLLPLTAWLVRAGLKARDAAPMVRAGKALLDAAGLLAPGVLLPGWIIVNAASLASPFAELWWLLGMSSLLQIGILTYLKAPERRHATFAVFLLIGSALGLPLWRMLLFSVFS